MVTGTGNADNLQITIPNNNYDFDIVVGSGGPFSVGSAGTTTTTWRLYRGNGSTPSFNS